MSISGMYPQEIKDEYMRQADLLDKTERQKDKSAVLLSAVIDKGAKKEPISVNDLIEWHKTLSGNDRADFEPTAQLQALIDKINSSKTRLRTTEAIELDADVFCELQQILPEHEPLARLVVAYLNARASMPIFVFKAEEKQALSKHDKTAMQLFFAGKIKEFLFRNDKLATLTSPVEGSTGTYRCSDGTEFRHEWTDLMRIERAWQKANSK